MNSELVSLLQMLPVLVLGSITVHLHVPLFAFVYTMCT